ncbi:MAG: DUF6489 family protein [Pseudomonadota bacterium]
MKITIEVDCTPEEARAFLGLPEVRALQERLLTEMENRMAEYLRQTDPQTLVEQWMPFGVKGVEQWQQMWAQMLTTASGLAPRPPRGPDDPDGR